MSGDGSITPTEDASGAPGVAFGPPELPPPAPLPAEPVPRRLSRRRLVVLASALALLAIGLVVALVVILGTQTRYGRERLRSMVLDMTKDMKGRLYIGAVGGNLFTGVTIDSLELRDEQDSLLVATGPIAVTYDPRDLVDRRVLLRHVRVTRPVVVIKKHADGVWNYRRLFPSRPSQRRGSERGLGDFVVIDSADISGGTFVLTLPWRPADSLANDRRRRDSAITANLNPRQRCDAVRCWGEIRRDAEGFKRTYRWSEGAMSFSHVRLADPDSVGRVFHIAHLSAAESDPPMRLRHAEGIIRVLKDTAWLDLPRFTVGGSQGQAKGRVIWGDSIVQRSGAGPDAPVIKQCRDLDGNVIRVPSANERLGGCSVRYDVHVRGDSVLLADVNWVYPPLPLTGGGRLALHVRTQPRSIGVIDYAVDRMDMRTTGSRLTGRVTFAVGGAVLGVKDVTVNATPVDFQLLRRINGKPFPYPWAGTLTGRVVAHGGPVNRFHVDTARFTFRDANVPGATTIASASGELDILFPAYTAFRGLRVDVDQLDLRTLQFLNPNFPRVNGFVAGRATLDSSWLDVRFRDAEMAHLDGAGEPTRATGSGRATWGAQFMTWDLDLVMLPLSLTTLARSYPLLPVRGSWRGPLRIRGTSEALEVTTDLSGIAGRMLVEGTFDTYPPGFAARAVGRVEGLDPRALLDRPSLPTGALTAQFSMDVRGDTLTDLAGTMALAVERSILDGVRIYGGTARVAFRPGHMRIDTLTLETAAASLAAAGGLGLATGVRDSLAFTATVDSLGGLRRWLVPAGTPGTAGTRAAADSLAGTLRMDGVLSGGLEALAVRANLAGDGLRVNATRVEHLRGGLALADVTGAPRGTVGVRVDSAYLGGIAVTRAVLDADVLDARRSAWRLDAATRNGVLLGLRGAATVAGDTTRVRLDSLALAAGNDRWRLERPVELLLSPATTALTDLALAGSEGGRIAATLRLPADAPIEGRIVVEQLPLATLGLVAQAPVPYAGRLGATVTLAGTRDAPVLGLDGLLEGATVGDVSLQRVTTRWDYAARRACGRVTLLRGDRPVLVASGTLPLELALRPVADRRLDTAPLEVNVRSERVDLALVESFSESLQRATGTFEANVDVRGTWRQPILTGDARVNDGAVTLANVGVRLEGIAADLRFQGDTLAIRQLTAETRGATPGRITLGGGISFANLAEPTYDVTVTARNFLAVRRPRVAELELSTLGGRPLRLVGSTRGAVLTGGLEVTRGDIFIPELSQKKVVSLDDPEFYRIVDTSLFTNRTLLPDAPVELLRNLLVEGVQVRMGPNVWLRSSEADIKLGGAVSVTLGRDQREPDGPPQLALVGSLAAERGTFRLVRTFVVEPGSLQFDGSPDLNPALAISALYVLRQQNQSRADVPIRITIGGTLAQPTLTLSSADAIAREQSDLLSYLLTGQPNFDAAFATGDATLTTAANLGFDLASTFLSRGVSVLDYVTLQSGRLRAGTGSSLFSRNSGLDVLSSTRLAGGKQLTDRLWVNFSLGLCSVLGSGQPTGGTKAVTFENELGARLEYRLSRTWSATVSSEPSTSALACNQGGTGIVLTTPRQAGLDFSKKWEF